MDSEPRSHSHDLFVLSQRYNNVYHASAETWTMYNRRNNNTTTGTKAVADEGDEENVVTLATIGETLVV